MGKRGNGEDSITRRKKGGWMAQYGVYTATGRKRKSIYGKTRVEVAGRLAQAISDRDNGFAFDSQNLNVGDYLDSWLKNSVQDTVRVTTYQGYERIVRLHIKPTLEGIKLDRHSKPAWRPAWSSSYTPRCTRRSNKPSRTTSYHGT